MPNPESIRSRVKATDMILTSSASAGLPDPFHINQSAKSVRFMFDSLEHLNAWATFFGFTTTPGTPELGRVWHTAVIDLFDETIELTAHASVVAHQTVFHQKGTWGEGVTTCTCGWVSNTDYPSGCKAQAVQHLKSVAA